jgi:hypothetical protein
MQRNGAMGPGGARRAGGRWPVVFDVGDMVMPTMCRRVTRGRKRPQSFELNATGCNRMQLVSVTTFLFSHVFTCFHMFSQFFTCFHMFSHVFTCFHNFSHVFTCFHMFSRMAGYGNESSWFRSTISMVSGSMFLALRSTSHILTWCGSSSASIKAVFYKSFHLGILEHWIFRASWCVTSSHPLGIFFVTFWNHDPPQFLPGKLVSDFTMVKPDLRCTGQHWTKQRSWTCDQLRRMRSFGMVGG